MEDKFTVIPFDIELAKKITCHEMKGRVVTRDGRSVRILCFDAKAADCIVALIEVENGEEYCTTFTPKGVLCIAEESDFDLFLEVPEETTFVFRELVLVRDLENEEWKPAEFGYHSKEDGYVVIGGASWAQCRKFERNLLGKTK